MGPDWKVLRQRELRGEGLGQVAVWGQPEQRGRDQGTAIFSGRATLGSSAAPAGEEAQCSAVVELEGDGGA